MSENSFRQGERRKYETHDRQSNTLGSGGSRVDLRRQGPRNGAPTDSEREHEQEEHGESDLGLAWVRRPVVLVEADHDGRDGVPEGHGDTSNEERPLPAKSVERIEGGEAGSQLKDDRFEVSSRLQSNGRSEHGPGTCLRDVQ